MKRFILTAAIAGVAIVAVPAQARVQVSIDLSSQRMSVQSSTGSYVWPISSGRSGFFTPRGSYAPTSLRRMHYSRKYHMSPMPHSIFFRGGYAIHGTYSTSQLGRPASHGCIRLSPGNAAALYSMVQREGARISITGSPPGGTMMAARQKSRAKTFASRARVAPPMAYVPGMIAPSVRVWQHSPYQYPYGYNPYGY